MTVSLNIGTGLTPAAVPDGHTVVLQIGEQLVALGTRAGGGPCMPPPIDLSAGGPQTTGAGAVVVMAAYAPGTASPYATLHYASGSTTDINYVGNVAHNATVDNVSVGAVVGWFNVNSLDAGWKVTVPGFPGQLVVRYLPGVTVQGTSGNFSVGGFDLPSQSGVYSPPNPAYCTYGVNIATHDGRWHGVGGLAASTVTPSGVYMAAAAFGRSALSQQIDWEWSEDPDVDEGHGWLNIAQMEATR